MSKVIIYRCSAKETYNVARATVVATWMPGQLFTLNTTGEFGQVGSGSNVIGVGQDDDTELSAPPTGSLVTVLYGSGTRVDIDHTTEVLAGNAARAYSTDAPLTASIYGLAGSTLPTLQRSPQSGSVNADLYCNGIGQFSLLPAQLASSSVGWSIASTVTPIAKMVKVPTADNNYTIGVILRV
jgi:hypothetical protein